jgi:hypothetical protein
LDFFAIRPPIVRRESGDAPLSGWRRRVANSNAGRKRLVR